MLPIPRETQRQLSQQYQNNTLPHALIIQGMEGAGQDALAAWLINLLICQQPLLNSKDRVNEACGQCKACLLNKNNNYPDHLFLKSDNKTLGVDDIRRGNTFLEKTAHLAKIKTILIPQADRMTIAAANALLKTLEEPNNDNIIVLITNDMDIMLPTIVSRCAIYAIRPSVGKALLAELTGEKSNHSSLHDTAYDEAYLNISHLPELTDKKTQEEFFIFNDAFIDYLLNPQIEAKLLDLIVENKHSFRWLEKIICNLQRNYYGTHISDQKRLRVNNNITSNTINQLYQTIINSNKLLKSNIQANQQFVSEQLLMAINNIIRPAI